MKDLPAFTQRPLERVQRFAELVLTNEYQTPPQAHLRQLIAYPDGHYRAVFEHGYFILVEGQTEPSKSQWNSLKKKFKRHEPLAFIFKEHGETTCGEAEARCLYIDFGFLANTDRV